MALSIKDEETDRLARELAEVTDESITRAVGIAISERLERLRAGRRQVSLADELQVIARRVAELPVLDDRSPDEIVGYDVQGLPR